MRVSMRHALQSWQQGWIYGWLGSCLLPHLNEYRSRATFTGGGEHANGSQAKKREIEGFSEVNTGKKQLGVADRGLD
jgi:hypothetical protein